MEFRDLKKQYLLHKQEIDQAISSVLLQTDFIMGRAVKELERDLAEYVGTKHCVTCGNGTDALQLALMAWEVGNGDAVFVPDFTFFSSGEVVPLCGATPVFVDISMDTFNLDPDQLEFAIEECLNKGRLKPKVIIAVDLFGQPADYDRIGQIAQKYNLLLLEDGAQGFGGRIRDKVACSFGDISTTSFFPAKPLGCYGDGGAVFTDDDCWADRLRSLKVHGKGEDKYDNIRIGINSRLDTIQAAVLSTKLSFFEEEIASCSRVASLYTHYLKDIVKTPAIPQGMRSSWAQYTILLQNSEERDRVMRKLKENGIPTAVYYKKPMHKQTAFLNEHHEEVCPRTEEVSRCCLSLPMHAYLKDEEVEKISKIICLAVENVEK